MAQRQEGFGCRDAAVSTIFLVGFAAALFALGLTLINRDVCTGRCESVGLTALYAGSPVSAVFGVLTDSVVVAWPLDLTLWVSLGFLIAKVSRDRGRAPLGLALLAVLVALAYGLVLSQFVELAV